MQFTYATRPGSDKANEDFVGGVGETAVLLDGAGGPAELANGCVHGTPWYVRSLGLQLFAQLSNEPDVPLAGLLAQSIAHVADLHRDTCDLAHPGSPSSTVAALRARDAEVDYLVLSDAVVVLDLDEGVRAFTDRRIDQLGIPTRERMRHLATGSAAHQEQRLQLVQEQPAGRALGRRRKPRCGLPGDHGDRPQGPAPSSSTAQRWCRPVRRIRTRKLGNTHRVPQRPRPSRPDRPRTPGRRLGPMGRTLAANQTTRRRFGLACEIRLVKRTARLRTRADAVTCAGLRTTA